MKMGQRLRELRRLAIFGAPLALLLLMAGRLVGDARADSLTIDEPVYIQSGICALTQRVDPDSTSPLIFKVMGGAGALILGKPAAANCEAALPSTPSEWATQSVFAVSPTALQQLTLAARLPIIMLALLLAIVVFLWARALYGYVGGLLAMAIVSLEPTFLGHAHLVTGDLSLAFGVVLALAAHWRWTQTRHWRWLLIAGAALGWALLSKASGLAILPVLLILEIAFGSGPLLNRLRHAIAPLITMGGTAWTFVCLTYLVFTTSPRAHGLPAPLAWLTAPQWIASLEYQVHHIQVGHPAYLNGQVAMHGFWPYFLEAIALKTTLGLLLLAIAAAIIAVGLRHRASGLYLWLPIAAVVLAATAGGIDIGVRYVLPIYPLMAVAAGLVVAALGSVVVMRRLAGGIALAALLLASLAGASHDLAYFNELAGAEPAAYLSDSNLDWGQDAWRLKAWWDASGRPGIVTDYFGELPLSMYGVKSCALQSCPESSAGYVAISVQRMTTSAETIGEPAENGLAPVYRELLSSEPTARVGTSIRVYQRSGSSRLP